MALPELDHNLPARVAELERRLDAMEKDLTAFRKENRATLKEIHTQNLEILQILREDRT